MICINLAAAEFVVGAELDERALGVGRHFWCRRPFVGAVPAFADLNLLIDVATAREAMRLYFRTRELTPLVRWATV